MLKDWNGLGEVTEVTELTALWREGLGRNSHKLKLQELGGFKVCLSPGHIFLKRVFYCFFRSKFWS